MSKPRALALALPITVIMAVFTIMSAIMPPRAALAQASGNAGCYAVAKIDVVGDLALYAVYNVTSPPVLLVVPARSPIAYFAYENGTQPLPVSFNGTDLTVAVDSPGVVNVSYLSLQATSKKGALWEANFTMPCGGDVILPKGATPIYVSPIPIQAYSENESPVLVMPYGPVTIDYMVPPPTVTTSSVITSPSTSITTITSSSPMTPVRVVMSAILPMVIVAVVIIAGAGAAIAFMKRGGGAGPPTELDDRDRSILSAIGRLGGEATASQIMNETQIPKTPLYRRLDKLVKMGYLEEGIKGGLKVYRCKRPGCK
ncbi:MAG: helix-turn-helix transcriptional regulator [Acidilobus sp.]